MLCPKCNVEMSPKSFDGVEVDRCFGCGGVWLDKGELEQIDDKNIATLVDVVGNTAKTEIMDRIPAHCPRCDNDMITLRGANDVPFDWCDQCEGMFFDRGELAAMNVFSEE
jgi:hypothetical protein